MCLTALDPPPSTGGLRRRHVPRSARSCLPAQEGSDITMCPMATGLPLGEGGLWCRHVSHGSRPASRHGRAPTSPSTTWLSVCYGSQAKGKYSVSYPLSLSQILLFLSSQSQGGEAEATEWLRERASDSWRAVAAALRHGSTVAGHRLLVLVMLLYGAALPPLPMKTTTVASSRMCFIRSLSRRGVVAGTSHVCLAYTAPAIFSSKCDVRDAMAYSIASSLNTTSLKILSGLFYS
jgi:hypothetical protein